LNGRGRQTGRVVEFDERGGYGHIEADDRTRRFFHCVAIADGSRTIAVGTPVTFRLVPGLAGRWEAGDIRPDPIASASKSRQ
jgi:cold shock CspA family protein